MTDLVDGAGPDELVGRIRTEIGDTPHYSAQLRSFRDPKPNSTWCRAWQPSTSRATPRRRRRFLTGERQSGRAGSLRSCMRRLRPVTVHRETTP